MHTCSVLDYFVQLIFRWLQMRCIAVFSFRRSSCICSNASNVLSTCIRNSRHSIRGNRVFGCSFIFDLILPGYPPMDGLRNEDHRMSGMILSCQVFRPVSLRAGVGGGIVINLKQKSLKQLRLFAPYLELRWRELNASPFFSKPRQPLL